MSPADSEDTRWNYLNQDVTQLLELHAAQGPLPAKSGPELEMRGKA